MAMLPCPIWPLAQHVGVGQNDVDVSIGLSVSVCLDTSCRWFPFFSSFPLPFHHLGWLYLHNIIKSNKPIPEILLIAYLVTSDQSLKQAKREFGYQPTQS